jgi:hypothetical protein
VGKKRQPLLNSSAGAGPVLILDRFADLGLRFRNCTVPHRQKRRITCCKIVTLETIRNQLVTSDAELSRIVRPVYDRGFCPHRVTLAAPNGRRNPIKMGISGISELHLKLLHPSSGRADFHEKRCGAASS